MNTLTQRQKESIFKIICGYLGIPPDATNDTLQSDIKMLSKTFRQTGDFNAYYAAEEFLGAAGFSIGSMQKDMPVGIMHGDFLIPKWKNLGTEDIKQLHGIIRGDKRSGPVTVELLDAAPHQARLAFAGVAA